MLKFNHFKTLLQELKLFDEYMPILISKGFDEWETLTELTEPLLLEIGITNPIIIKEILSCLKSAGAYDINLHENQEKKVLLDKKMLYKGIFTKNEKHLPEEKFLSSLLTMVLNDKSLEKISSDLCLCRHLNTLQLTNNRIEKLENMTNLKELKILRLENNFISKLENLENLKNLEKIYLSQNCIFRLEGLNFCKKLKEIYINDQKLSEKLGFEFDEETMKSLGNSLEILEAEKNHLKKIKNLEYLMNIRTLRLSDNLLENFENIDKQLYCMGNLKSLDLKKNPITKIHKYRDQIIMIVNENFGELDDKDILPHEREFIMKFYNIQNARGISKKPKNSTKTKLEIAGNEIKGWNQIDKIFEEDSKREETDPTQIQINRPLNKASNFTPQIYENTKHMPHIYSKKQTF